MATTGFNSNPEGKVRVGVFCLDFLEALQIFKSIPFSVFLGELELPTFAARGVTSIVISFPSSSVLGFIIIVASLGPDVEKAAITCGRL